MIKLFKTILKAGNSTVKYPLRRWRYPPDFAASRSTTRRSASAAPPVPWRARPMP